MMPKIEVCEIVRKRESQSESGALSQCALIKALKVGDNQISKLSVAAGILPAVEGVHLAVRSDA